MLTSLTSGEVDILPVVLVGTGSFFCAKSIRMTFKHAASPSFEAPGYKKGRKHPRYHAFRGATLAIGAVATMNFVVWRPKVERAEKGFESLWISGAIAAVSYFSGWWLPKPLLKLKTPNWTAETVHILAALLCCGGLMSICPFTSTKLLTQ